MNRIQSYVPESEFFDPKATNGCRIFHDDCAIVSAAEGFPLVASRGFSVSAGAPFFKALSFSERAMERIENFLGSQEKLLLIRERRQTYMIFSALLLHTGLLLVLRVKCSGQDVHRVLKTAGRDGFYPIFRPNDDAAPKEPSPREHVTEIFYYTDRILHATPPLDLITRLRLIAGFIGCRLASVTLSPEIPAADARHTNILIAFFLCLLLILRCRTGDNLLSAKSENVGKVQADDCEESPAFHICLRHAPIRTHRGMLPDDEIELKDDDSSPLAPLLALPCFSSILHTAEDDAHVFEIPMCALSPFMTIRAQGDLIGILLRISLH